MRGVLRFFGYGLEVFSLFSSLLWLIIVLFWVFSVYGNRKRVVSWRLGGRGVGGCIVLGRWICLFYFCFFGGRF